MRLCLVPIVSGIFATNTRAYAPLQMMRGSANGLVVLPKGLLAMRRSTIIPPELTTSDPVDNESPVAISYIALKPDETIMCGDMGCMEAVGDQIGNSIRVSRCTGAPSQKWNWLSDGHGRNQIQLKNTDMCLSGLDGALVELQKCGSLVTDAWKIEDPAPMSTYSQGHEFSSAARHAIVSLCALAGMGVLALSVGLWGWRTRSRVLALSQSGAHVNDDKVVLPRSQGGACVNDDRKVGIFLTDPLEIHGKVHDRTLCMNRSNGEHTKLRSEVMMALREDSEATVPCDENQAGIKFFGVWTSVSLSQPHAHSLETSQSPYSARAPVPFPPSSDVCKLMNGYPAWLCAPPVTCGLLKSMTSDVDNSVSVSLRLPFVPPLLTFARPTATYATRNSEPSLVIEHPIKGGLLAAAPTGSMVFSLSPKTLETRLIDFTPSIIGASNDWGPLRWLRARIYSWTQGVVHRYVMTRFHLALWSTWKDEPTGL